MGFDPTPFPLADSVGDFMAMGIGFFMVVIVPLVAILLHHQRKMAEFFQGGNEQRNLAGQVERLESEVRELKGLVNDLILRNEGSRQLQERTSPPRVPEIR